MSDSWIIEKADGVLVRVRVKPRASREKIEGPSPEGSLTIKLTSPPVDNRANQELIALLAKKLRVPKSAILIQSGERSRNKSVFIKGIEKPEAAKKLAG